MINYVYQLVSPRVFTIEYTDISFDDQVVVKPTYMAVPRTQRPEGITEQVADGVDS